MSHRLSNGGGGCGCDRQDSVLSWHGWVECSVDWDSHQPTHCYWGFFVPKSSCSHLPFLMSLILASSRLPTNLFLISLLCPLTSLLTFVLSPSSSPSSVMSLPSSSPSAFLHPSSPSCSFITFIISFHSCHHPSISFLYPVLTLPSPSSILSSPFSSPSSFLT